MTATARTAKATPTRIAPLTEGHAEEALAFLRERPLHTVIMAGLLRQHGPVVPAPAGGFYACRGPHGDLEGVALVGRATMFEARTTSAITAFADQARLCPSVRMIMGEADDLGAFWGRYAAGEESPRLFCREFFYQFSRPYDGAAGVAGLRQATPDDLDQVVSAHARMCFEESGLDPLAEDPEGFRRRCASRVERGKVWTLIEGRELIFKADVVTETPEATYIEGLWVNPAHRLKGYGRSCWAALSRVLMDGVPAICGFVNAGNPAARNFYKGVGGVLVGNYDKVYL